MRQVRSLGILDLQGVRNVLLKSSAIHLVLDDDGGLEIDNENAVVGEFGVVDDHGLVVVLFTSHAGQAQCTTSAKFDGICLVVVEGHALTISNSEDCTSLRA